MPNQRAENQTMVAFALDNELLSKVDAVRRREGRDRSTFIRLAIIEKLKRMGINVDESLAYSPDRAFALNDKPNSSKASSAVEGVAKKVKYKIRRKPTAV